jgi:hypothetical protein
MPTGVEAVPIEGGNDRYGGDFHWQVGRYSWQRKRHSSDTNSKQLSHRTIQIFSAFRKSIEYQIEAGICRN